MELFILLFVMMCLSPVGAVVVKRVTPQIKAGYNHKKALARIEKRKLELETARSDHKKKMFKEQAIHRQELSNFDHQIKEIERPAIRKMVERRVIEASTGHTPTDKAYWLQEKHILLEDYKHISKLCEGQEVTELDVNLLQGIVDRMDVVNNNLNRIAQAEAQKERLERDKLKAPAELLDFLETVNDPDADPITQMKATRKFVGGHFTVEDVYRGKVTSDNLLDMADKKIARLQSIPNFDTLLQTEGLRRMENTDNPQRLLELWGVQSVF